MGAEKGVGLGELVVAEESAVGAERRWMDGLEHQMAGGVDEGGFLLGIAAPEEEDGVGAVSVDDGDNGIGELLPSVVGVGVGLPLSHGEGCVEQQHALVRPAQQAAAGRDGCAGVVAYLAQDILQRRGPAFGGLRFEI